MDYLSDRSFVGCTPFPVALVKNNRKYSLFNVQKLPVEIHRKIYSYIRDEVMLHTWMDIYDMDEIIDGICDENYNAANTRTISNVYRLYDKDEAKYLLWRHTMPVKEKRMGYWYDDSSTDYHKFAKDLGKKMTIEYGKILESNDQEKITKLYTVCSIFIYMYNNSNLLFDERLITK